MNPMYPLGWLFYAAYLAAQSPHDVEFFEKRIRPVLATRCQGCHGPTMQMAGLDLSSAAGIRKGSDRGPVELNGDPAHSRLVQVIGYEERVKMPPTGKLSPEQIEDLKSWIALGAPWPEGETRPASSAKEPERLWSFQPVKECLPPPVRGESWIKSPIDRFVLSKLEQEGLDPAPPASKEALLRRVSYDLTGLPPSPRELASFLADSSPDAFASVVDRLLASPQYGEKWARHWLDVARYADSTGRDEDQAYPHAWRYRDYVIDAFNRDLRYDRFVTEQIAGDLLPESERAVVATGFLALGPKAIAQQDRRKMVYDVVDEQIDVTSRAFMGLTVACARCHDHKFDPIRTKDYYSLASIFASTKSFRNYGRPGAVAYLYYAPLEREAYERRETQRKSMYAAEIEMERVLAEEEARAYARLRPRLADYLEAAWRIAREGARSSDLASERKLDRAVLERWFRYLTQPGETKAYLSRWRAADRSTIAEVAAGYQTAYLKTAERWDETLAQWRKNFIEEVRQDRALPERPQIDKVARQFAVPLKEREPFFAETSFGDGPFALPESPRVAALRQQWERLKQALAPEPPMAHAVTDEEEPVRQTVFVRGDHNSPGEPVDKGFPPALGGEAHPAIPRGSGRLELARWLTRPDHPLTARVMVNRVWQGHFGEGLVRSPGNWGATGERPTHPELLDFLARRFIESGWSIKALHRMMLLSSTYQMSSHGSPDARERDPSNRWFSRFNRRRLTVEEIRDSLLTVDGALDRTLGGPLREQAGEQGSEEHGTDPEESRRRTIYLPVRRGSLAAILSMFDFGDATAPNESRTRTNVAPQALFMMNSKFVAQRSLALAKLLLDDGSASDAGRIERAFLLALTRKPSGAEIERCLAYEQGLENRLGAGDSRLRAWQSLCRILLSSNEFVYLD
ncbi:MAG: hypothetical protein DMG07_00260 [Acidobacteria bacterium]|nr:MAG: hypothetical protein DMG07_00260 [Acidobacteriota bacterium]